MKKINFKMLRCVYVIFSLYIVTELYVPFTLCHLVLCDLYFQFYKIHINKLLKYLLTHFILQWDMIQIQCFSVENNDIKFI